MATATRHEVAPDRALQPFARLPYGPQHKSGVWTAGCALLVWGLAWAWLSGSTDRWLVLAACSALAFSAPHAVGWMRDGVAPQPEPGQPSLLFEKRLGLWLLRLLVWRLPSLVGDLLVTSLWNLTGGRRAARAWRRQSAGLGPAPPAAVPTRGGGRARRMHPDAPRDDDPDTVEHRPPRGPAADDDGWSTTDEHQRPLREAPAPPPEESTFSDGLRDAFPDPASPRPARWRRAARWAQFVRDEDAERARRG